MQDRGTCKSQRRNLIPSRARLISSHLISFYFTLLFDENGQSTHLSQGLVLEALFPLCMWTFPYVKALFRRCNFSWTCIATVHIQQKNNEGGKFGSLHFHQAWCTLWNELHVFRPASACLGKNEVCGMWTEMVRQRVWSIPPLDPWGDGCHLRLRPDVS